MGMCQKNILIEEVNFTGIPLGVALQILYPPELKLIWAKFIFCILGLHFGTGYLVHSRQQHMQFLKGFETMA